MSSLFARLLLPVSVLVVVCAFGTSGELLFCRVCGRKLLWLCVASGRAVKSFSAACVPGCAACRLGLLRECVRVYAYVLGTGEGGGGGQDVPLRFYGAQ